MNAMDSAGEVLAGYRGLRAEQEAFYKDLHQHPELSHQERRTALRVASQLQGDGFNVQAGILAGSLRTPRATYGLPFGAAVWAAGYIVLPEAGLYKPIRDYDSTTLARDLSAHLAYGAGTGIAFWLVTARRP